jgi:hypothetical protein
MKFIGVIYSFLSILSIPLVGCTDHGSEPFPAYELNHVESGPTSADYQSGGAFYDAQIPNSIPVRENLPDSIFNLVRRHSSTIRDAWYFGGTYGCVMGNIISRVYISPKMIIRVAEVSQELESLGFVKTTGSVNGCTGTAGVRHYSFR